MSQKCGTIRKKDLFLKVNHTYLIEQRLKIKSSMNYRTDSDDLTRVNLHGIPEKQILLPKTFYRTRLLSGSPELWQTMEDK